MQVYSILVTGLLFTPIWLLVNSVYRDLRDIELHRTQETEVELWSVTAAEV